MPNILTPAQECARISHGFDCDKPRTGDAIECKHGRYWVFHQYPGWLAKISDSNGYWERIDWFQNPITWWRARRALKAGRNDC